MPDEILSPFVIIAVLLAVFLVPAASAAGEKTGTALSAPIIGDVTIFPANHVWNVRVDDLPVDPRSADYVSRIGSTRYLHPDFGSGLWEGGPIGIPFNIVTDSVRKQAVTFEYDDESDYGPYPIPQDPLIEGGGGDNGDRHLLIINRDENVLYELYAAEELADGSWHAGSGAIFDLNGYELRPEGWTSADAAGLAILPGLVRYDEVAAGAINHALRFTAPRTQRAYVWPARHYASSITDLSYPPMGQRFRLKASFDTSGYPYQARVVLEALRKYGMILSDNGAAWYISGAPDDRWDNDDLHTLQKVRGSDFEAVDESLLMIDPGSGQAQGETPGASAPPVSTSRPQTVTRPAGQGDGSASDVTGKGEGPGSEEGVLSFMHIGDVVKNVIAFLDRNGNGRIDGNDFIPFL